MPVVLRLICYLVLATGFVSAQEFNFEIEKGKVFTDDKSKTWVLFNADDGNGGAVILRLYFKGVNPKGYFLDSFDSQLNLKHRKEIVIDNNAIKNVFVKDGYVHLIEYRRNKKAKKDEFHLTSYSLEDFTSTSKEILSIDKRATEDPVHYKMGFDPIGQKRGLRSDLTGEVIISENQKYFLFNLHQKEKRQKYQRVILFDDQFQVVYDHKFDGDIEDEYYRYFDITLNEEDGTAYFLGKKFNNNSYSSSIHGSVNYVYQVYRIDKIGRKKNNIRVIDRYIKSLNINLINDKLYCFGSYSKNNVNKVKGISVFKLDANDLRIENSRYYPLSEQLYKDKFGIRSGERKSQRQQEISNLQMQDVDVLQNGDIVFFAEEFSFSNSDQRANDYYYSYEGYSYGDVYIGKIDKEEELKWMRAINKSSGSTRFNKEFLSYSSMTSDQSIWLFLNAKRIKLLNQGKGLFDDLFVSHKKERGLYAFHIDADGNITYQLVVPEVEDKINFRSMSGSLSNDEKSLFMEGGRKKSKQMLRLRFN